MKQLEKNTTLFCVGLEKISSTPRDILECNYYQGVEDRNKMDCNIFFNGNSVKNDGLFVIRLYAKNVKKALKNAIKVRDQVIESGDWNMAWEKYRLQQSALKFSTF